MARSFTYADVHPWKVINHQGKVAAYPKDSKDAGKPMNNLKGYGDAHRYVTPGLVAVRA